MLLSRNEPSPFLGGSFILSMFEQVVNGAVTLFNLVSTALAGWTGCVMPKPHDRQKNESYQIEFKWWLTRWRKVVSHRQAMRPHNLPLLRLVSEKKLVTESPSNSVGSA